jgi:HK97 family phage portal protein
VRILGLDIRRAGALAPLATTRGTGGWRTVVREPSTGAWQQNLEINTDTALAYFAVFACTTLIAADIGKVRLRLVVQDREGIWTETESAAFSPVLRKPNRYQTFPKFIEQWVVSKLIKGNTYVLKQRDERGVVTQLYVLDPARVVPLVTPDGAVYYELRRDDLSGIPEADRIVVPASEIIHDLMVALFHPLVGVPPIYACGLGAAQGLAIQNNSAQFFANGSHPGGTLNVPGAISDEKALRLKENWETSFGGPNSGRVAILGDNVKYEQLTLSAEESQLIEQLKWTAETVCACFHVPPFMIYVGPQPAYGNPAPMFQQYYSQCLQTLFTGIETSLDEGLGLGKPFGNLYGTEFDIDDLIWLDHETKTKAAEGAIGSGAVSPNEARRKYYGLGPVAGGDSPYMQQQYYSLEALATRDAAAARARSGRRRGPRRGVLPEGLERAPCRRLSNSSRWSSMRSKGASGRCSGGWERSKRASRPWSPAPPNPARQDRPVRPGWTGRQGSSTRGCGSRGSAIRRARS